ncbi:MAG: hypothetical protein PWR26_859 [Methanosarcinales archaeon]|uniref:PGF-pre-PGF domain-containing protein n=1 Tax=Methermicoccus shengliensis TaxID=660064 RepID=UPI000693B0AD|nr:PGF-pre-PGF domain-containing protein [Methermicoccus shengliensis]MDI3488142.1 hypothetical protein [Methanosarcinales archaeon]
MRRLMLILIALLVMLPSMASAADVVRDTPAVVSPGAEFNVTLTISGIQVGGVVETLPAGFTFVSTDYPWYNISGQKVAFAIVNSTRIVYTVKAPSGGSGAFTGLYEDLLDESNGSIASTTVTVKTSSSGSEAVESSVVPTISVPVPSIGAGERKSISLPSEARGDHVCFTSLDIAARDEVHPEVMKVEVYDVAPAGVEAPRYQKVLGYLRITTGLEDAVESVHIHFKVKTSSIQHPENVVLLRWDGAWTPLDTSYVGEENGYYVFEAKSPGLSLYAVAETAGSSVESSRTSTESVSSNATATTSGETAGAGAEKTPGFGALLAVLCITGIALSHRRR